MVSKVAIIGTGAFAQGCAALINSSSSGAYVKMGSRSLKGDCEEVCVAGRGAGGEGRLHDAPPPPQGALPSWRRLREITAAAATVARSPAQLPNATCP
jgi:hypothetical protein